MTTKQELAALAAELRFSVSECRHVDDRQCYQWADRLDQIAVGLPDIPTNWLDPLLTGPDAVIGKPPYNCKDIERLLNALQLRRVAIPNRPDRRTPNER